MGRTATCLNLLFFSSKDATFKAWHFLGSHLYVSGYTHICLSRYLSFFFFFYTNMSQLCLKYYDSVFLIVGVLWFSWFGSFCRSSHWNNMTQYSYVRIITQSTNQCLTKVPTLMLNVNVMWNCLEFWKLGLTVFCFSCETLILISNSGYPFTSKTAIFKASKNSAYHSFHCSKHQ